VAQAPHRREDVKNAEGERSGDHGLAWRHAGALVLGLAVAGVCAPPVAAATIPIGRVAIVGARVESSRDGRAWKELASGTLLRTGDWIRSDSASLARFDIGWAKLILGPDSQLVVPPSTLLSLRLEAGRLEQSSEGSDIVKVRTPEALVTGKGQVVVRRRDDTTSISARLGRFRVEAGGQTVRLDPGFGTAIRHGQPPLPPQPLPSAPDKLVPSADPVYVERGKPLQLEWTSLAKAHSIELTSVGSDVVVLQVAVGESPASIAVPWPGTYRWRVVAQDERGIEGLPSRSGVICVVDW
jgi:hypothetical protein